MSGSRKYLIQNRSPNHPTSFLESPPRTQLLKWFLVLAESMTISDLGLFNNQTLISHRMVLLHFKSQFTIDIRISYSQNLTIFEITFTSEIISHLKSYHFRIHISKNRINPHLNSSYSSNMSFKSLLML